MVETTQIEPQRERAFWREFVRYLTGSTIDNRIPFPPAVAPVVASSQPTKESGWTTEAQFLTTADNIADAESEDESDDEEFPDDAKHRRQLKAIFALLGGMPHSKVAKEANVSCRQLSRWKKDTTFIKLYEQTKAEVFRESVSGMKGILTAGGIVGAKALSEIAEDKAASDTARVAAARALTALALEINDLETIAADIAALKAARE